MSKRVLVIAYIFPPTGGAGVQRVTKFVKYLPEHGWLPSVLTVENPSVPLFDTSLEADIPHDTIIRRAKTWEPAYSTKLAIADENVAKRPRSRVRRTATSAVRRVGKMFLQPDPQILWGPHAIREGKRLLRQVRHHAILATAPPFSTFLVGSALSKACGLPLVLDYRDEWDLAKTYFENQRPDAWSRWVQSRMQNRAVRTARAIVATTQASANSLKGVCATARSTAEVTCIYNGFDPDDFSTYKMNGVPRTDTYRLVYVGTVWELTSPAPIVQAARMLSQRHPDLIKKLEVVFVGRRIGTAARALDELRTLPCHVVEKPYVPHAEIVQILRASDCLCVLLSDLPGVDRVVPAKVFEYLAVQRPILAIAPPGELWDILADYAGAKCFKPDDAAGIADYLATQIKRQAAGERPDASTWSIPRFDRRNQGGQLAELLGRVCAQVS